MIEEEKLTEIRQQIDDVDTKLVRLLNKRAQLALQAGIAKGGKNIVRPEREDEVVRQALADNKGPLANEALEEIFRHVIQICRTIQYNK